MFQLLLSFLFLISTVRPQQITECPLGWILYDTNCYLFSLYPELSYEEADKTCLGQGAGLVSVNTEEEYAVLQTNLQQFILQGPSVWYTSGSFYEGKLKWEADGVFGFDDYRFWINNQARDSPHRGMHVVYRWSGIENKYKWDRVTEDVKGRYVCEIPLVETKMITEGRRDITYGTNFSDATFAPKGPVFKIQPQNLVVTDRSIQPSLECVAQGMPQPSYLWLQGEQYNNELKASSDYILTNGKVTFLNVSSEYSDYYQCRATNQFGSVLSNQVKITHGFLNEFSNVVPGRYNVSLYKGTYLNCNHPNYKPAAIFQWQKGSEFLQTSLNQYYFLSNDGNLYFSEVQAQDSGYYHCLVTLAAMQDEVLWTSQPPSVTSKGIYLNVTGQTAADFPPEIQDAFPRVFPSTPMKGQKIEVECLAYGRMPLEYSWSREGKPMPSKAKTIDLNRVLVIEDVQFEDEGTYTCHVRSNKGSDRKSFTFTLSNKPYFVRPLSNKNLDVGSQLTWRCEAIARPRAVFLWFKNAYPIKPVPGKVEIYSNVLKLMNLQESDSGMYQCGAKNVYGNVFSGAQLRVLSFKPTFQKNPLPSITLAAINGNITIPCRPQAAPAPIITWLHNGSPMSLSQIDSPQGPQLLPNNDLKIVRMNVGDTGMYTCRAENDLGRAETTTNLTAAAEIQWQFRPNDITTVNWNETQFIRCEVSYNFDKYDLIYVWKFNGQPIDIENDPYYQKQSMMNGLLIRYAQFKHQGEYECVATTTVSSISAKGKLMVYGPPGEPAGVYAVKTSATPYSIQLKWTKPPERGSPILNYTIEAMTTFNPVWRKVGEVSDIDAGYGITDDVKDSKRRQYVVTGLYPYNNYTFRIYATNSFSMPGSYSIPSKSYTLQMAKPEFPVSKVFGGNGTFGTLTILWTPLAMEQEGGPDITYYAYWRKKGSTSLFQKTELIGRRSKFTALLTKEDYYLQYEVIVGVRNRAGVGPNSTIYVIYSAEGSEYDVNIGKFYLSESQSLKIHQNVPPHPPTGVSGGGINGTALLVTWNPMANTREIIHGTIQGFEINVVDLNDPNRKSVTAYHYGVLSSGTVIGLEPNADFWVTVQVFNSAGESFPSERTRMSTNAEPPRHYPEYVQVRSHGSDSVYVKWRGVLCGINEEVLIGYKLRWYPANENIKFAKDVVINNRKTEGVITGIEKRVVYKLRVLGYSNGGDGKMSPVTYFTLGGQGVPVTDPAMTSLVAGSQKLRFSFILLIMSIILRFPML